MGDLWTPSPERGHRRRPDLDERPQADSPHNASGGATVANLTGPGTPGLNRVAWDLKPTSDVLTEYGGEGKRFVPAGEYTVSLSFGKTKQDEKLTVTVAPGVKTR